MIDYKKVMEKEGNRKSFKYKGFDALILRVALGYSGHLCGYVQIPKDHKLYAMHYDEIEQMHGYNVPAHHGLTFSGKIKGEGDGYWIGFDCAHINDHTPHSDFSIPGTIYRDMDYVENNIKEIIDYIQ